MNWDSERLHAQVSHVDSLLSRMEEHSSEPGGRIGDQAVQAVVDLYGQALARVVDVAEQAGLLVRLLDDELLEHLLLVHGLHPDNPEQRVRRVLAEIGPQLETRGVKVGFGRIDNSVLHLIVDSQGCSSAAASLTGELEQIIHAAAPEIERIEVSSSPVEPVLVGINELFPSGQPGACT